MKPTALSIVSLLFLAFVAPLPSGAQFVAEPGPTLADDLATTRIALAPGYVEARPRLLFGANDVAALKQQAEADPELWQRVLRQAQGMGRYVPDAERIRTGRQYWRAEWMLSGAVAYLLTGERAYRDDTVRWMLAHCAEDTWGVGWRENVDLFAGWYLYYISLAYDVLHGDLTDDERAAIHAGLISHAEAVYESLLPPQAYRFDQNHTYIPTIGLATTALALAGEVPQTQRWLKVAGAVLNRCRYVLGDDGYYYEGTGYWQYALHWHARYADLAARAFGGRWHDLPALAKNWRYPLHMSVPGSPFMWDIGDTGAGAECRPTARKLAWNHMLYAVAAANDDGRTRAVADWLVANSQDPDDPAMQLLWTARAAKVKPADLTVLPPHHYFADHGVVAWRSGWDDAATCYLFRCGPPQGHAATDKLRKLDDWTRNDGHVHPDIGAFWIFAGGEYLAVDTGYLARKFTRDHNTLLIDGQGQGVDGSYWVYRGWPYERFDAARIIAARLTDAYGYAVGDFGSVYPPPGAEASGMAVRRHLAMTKRFLLIVDDIADTEPRTVTWLLHTDTPIAGDGTAFVSTKGAMWLFTYLLFPKELEADIGPARVIAGRGPNDPTPTDRGYRLAAQTPTAAARQRLVSVLLPVPTDQPPPRQVRLVRNDVATAVVRIDWAAGPAEIVTVDLSWKAGDTRHPVTFRAGGR